MTFDQLLLLLLCISSIFCGFWLSPRALMWAIAKMCARIDGLRAQRESFAKYLRELEER